MTDVSTVAISSVILPGLDFLLTDYCSANTQFDSGVKRTVGSPDTSGQQVTSSQELTRSLSENK